MTPKKCKVLQTEVRSRQQISRLRSSRMALVKAGACIPTNTQSCMPCNRAWGKDAPLPFYAPRSCNGRIPLARAPSVTGCKRCGGTELGSAVKSGHGNVGKTALPLILPVPPRGRDNFKAVGILTRVNNTRIKTLGSSFEKYAHNLYVAASASS